MLENFREKKATRDWLNGFIRGLSFRPEDVGREDEQRQGIQAAIEAIERLVNQQEIQRSDWQAIIQKPLIVSNSESLRIAVQRAIDVLPKSSLDALIELKRSYDALAYYLDNINRFYESRILDLLFEVPTKGLKVEPRQLIILNYYKDWLAGLLTALDWRRDATNLLQGSCGLGLVAGRR